MKGFIYLIEIAVAAIIMTIVLSVFFSIRIKQDWEKPDLISAGNNLFNSVRNDNSFVFNVLEGNLSKVNLNIPANVKYGLKIIGSPKSNINIGCYINCDYLKGLLGSPPIYGGSVYVNGRWINFTVNPPFDINAGNIPPYFDAIVLINYTNYSDATIKSRLNNYLNNGGVVIGINATFNNADNGLNNTFNLTAVSASSQTINFTFYNTFVDDIAKYFLGIGMDAYNQWYIWENLWNVYYGNDGNNYVNITSTSDNRTFLHENDTFNLTHPIDGNKYFFKVKKIWYPNRVDFQILNKSFAFKDFSEHNVAGNNIVGTSNYAALTTNNSAVWISDFPQSDEYRTLLKAAILSRIDNWTPKGVYTTKEKTTVSSFVSLCCDMPETTELYLTLWYEI